VWAFRPAHSTFVDAGQLTPERQVEKEHPRSSSSLSETTIKEATMTGPNDSQENAKRQEPVLDRFAEFPTIDRLRGGQEESDLSEPRSGFDQDDPYLEG
jgi:hypothetical protein